MPLASAGEFLAQSTLASAKPCFSISEAFASIPFASATAFFSKTVASASSFFFQAGCLGLLNLGFRQTDCGCLSRFGLGEHLGGGGFSLGRILVGFCFDADLCRPSNSLASFSACASFVWRISSSCSFHFCRGDLNLLQPAQLAATSSVSLMRSCSSTTARSTATRSRITSWMFRFSDLDRLSLSRLSATPTTSHAFGRFEVTIAVQHVRVSTASVFSLFR